MDRPKPLYIVGVGRSGTSLLQSIIGTHTQVKVLPETSILRRYIFANQVDWAALSSDSTVARYEPLKEKVSEAGESRFELIGIYKAVLFQNADVKYVLEKDPRLVESLNLLPLVNRDHKVITITRDPRDVLVSKKTASWSSGRSLFSYLTTSHVQLADSRRSSFQDNVFHVSYESLLQNPARQISSICQFLDLDFEPTMMEYQQTSKALIHDEEVSWKKETLKPLMRENHGKWKGKLSDFEAYMSVTIANSAYSELGYKQQTDLKRVKKIQALILKNVIIFASFTYRIIRKFKQRKVAQEL